jgi:hypothetical protein
MTLRKFLSSRFPPRQALVQVFLMCAFPVAVWSWIIFFYDLPSFLLSLRLSQIINIFAYLQVIILIESALLFALDTLLAVLLPPRLFLSHYVPQSTLLILALALWAVGFHLYSEQIALGNLASDPTLLYFWTVVWAVVFLVLSILTRYWTRWNTLILSFVDRLSIVSGVYLFFPLLSLPYVLLRYVVLQVS